MIIIDFLKSPSSCLFVTRSAASQPNIFYPIFYPEIHEVDLWQVYLIQRIILFILWRNSEQERHPDVKCFAELVFTVASLPRGLIKPLFALGGCELQSLLAISDA